eukprot:m.240220 g.240220  ORF g.240220 m.240220 type:complete len:218 (-) comp23187_c0_seq1:32-685(-)
MHPIFQTLRSYLAMLGRGAQIGLAVAQTVFRYTPPIAAGNFAQRTHANLAILGVENGPIAFYWVDWYAGVGFFTVGMFRSSRYLNGSSTVQVGRFEFTLLSGLLGFTMLRHVLLALRPPLPTSRPLLSRLAIEPRDRCIHLLQSVILCFAAGHTTPWILWYAMPLASLTVSKGSSVAQALHNRVVNVVSPPPPPPPPPAAPSLGAWLWDVITWTNPR